MELVRSKMLSGIRESVNNFRTYVVETKVEDDIGYKSVFADIIPLGEFVLANESEFPDYELYSFMKLCFCAKDTRDFMRAAELRHHELEILKTMVLQERMVLESVYGYGKEDVNDQEADVTPNEDTSSGKSEDEENKVIVLNNLAFSDSLDQLKEVMEDCSREYIMNRGRVASIGFDQREEEIYSLVASWCGKAITMAESLGQDTTSAAQDYCAKFLRNATVLTRMMGLALKSQSQVELESRIKSLEENLLKIDEYYSEPAKKLG